MTKREFVIAIIALVLGCIIATVGVTSEYENKIENLECQLSDINERYKNYSEITEMIVNITMDFSEEIYDELIDITDDMADTLAENELEVPYYNEDYFGDRWDEYAEPADVFGAWIAENVKH